MSLQDQLAENTRLVNALLDRKDEKIAELEARLHDAEQELALRYPTAAEIAEAVPRYAEPGSRMAILARGYVDAEARCVRAEEALRRIEELAVDAKAELLTPQTSGDKRSVAHLLDMIESVAAVPEEEKS